MVLLIFFWFSWCRLILLCCICNYVWCKVLQMFVLALHINRPLSMCLTVLLVLWKNGMWDQREQCRTRLYTISWYLFFLANGTVSQWYVSDFTFLLLLQLLNSQITPSQHLEREKAYDIVSGNSSFGFEYKVLNLLELWRFNWLPLMTNFRLLLYWRFHFWMKTLWMTLTLVRYLKPLALTSLVLNTHIDWLVRECVFPVVIFFWSAFLYPFLGGT